MKSPQRFVKRHIEVLDANGNPVPGLRSVSFRGIKNEMTLELGSPDQSVIIRSARITDRYGVRTFTLTLPRHVDRGSPVSFSEGSVITIQDERYRWFHGRLARLLRLS